MKQIHMMIGIPGSGKTTYVRALSKIAGYKVVSTDIVRQNNPQASEEQIWPLVYQMINNILETEDNVIFDATNVTKKVRDRFKENIDFYNHDYALIGYYLPTDYKVCQERVNIRNQMPGELFIPLDVISSYGEVIYPPTYEEGFQESKVITGAGFLLDGLVTDAYQGYGLYIRAGDKVIEEYSGFANIETGEPVKADTKFRLASVSKQFIAYGILTLLEKGKLSLDDKLYDLFENMPLYTKEITIHHLLTHTSGLLDYEEMTHTDEQIKDIDVLNYIKTTDKTYFKVGTLYKYSNTAYVILGLIIEKISNIKLGDYMKEEVFSKADMIDTIVNYQGETIITPRAYGNITINGKLQIRDQYWCSATIGDGGIYSSVTDLKKWINYLREIDIHPYYLMKKPNYINDRNTEYGYGLRVKEINGIEVVYHCGETIGTNTIIGYLKDIDMEFIFLTNKGDVDTSLFIENLRKVITKKEST